MSNQLPFSLRIFVADGDPDGLRIIERTNWVGKALVFPRALYPQVRSRPEFLQTGVYLLLGPRLEGEGEMLYIGEGDPVRPRLENHYANKDFWTRAVFFVAALGQLNKAHVQYLEARLVYFANVAKRVPLDNGNTPAEPTLSEADRADMDVFLSNILGMLPVLGIHAFEQSPSSITNPGTPLLFFQRPGITATGKDTSQGFVVQSGSLASLDVNPSIKEHKPGVIEMRNDLRKSGVLVLDGGNLRFTQNYTFSSSSFAASIISGQSTSGPREWRDQSGKTLKELQKAQAQG